MGHISLSQMVEKLATGPVLVSFPTDTVPALATRPEYADLIYAAKQRSPDKPLILMGASLTDLLPYVSGDAAALTTWTQTVSQHWPGQLTLVLPSSELAPPLLNPQGTGTLGIRVPNHPIALELLAQTGPLATTSANLSGQPPLTEPAAIARTFPDVVTLPPEAFTVQANSGMPSTVVKWTGQGWQVLRQGQIRL
ncbi:MAG: L-threonylcarbamoyladenylate synthase [Cyanobacteria bacterium P01_D01_bin.105]